MSNRWKIILIAVAFNLTFEYSLRGFVNLKLVPGLILLLGVTYFSLFTMVEDLIVRYKLKDYQLMLLAFFYGTIYMTWASGSIFYQPNWRGINIGLLLIINIVWWGAIQGVLTFYLANKISPRDWNHPQMSKVGWAVNLIVSLVCLRIFQLSPVVPHGSGQGQVTIFVILIISLVLTIISIKKNQETINFESNKVLDTLAWGSWAVFGLSAIFNKGGELVNSSILGSANLKIIILWTLLVALAMLIFRIVKKPIPV